MPDAASSSFGVEANMARPPKRPSRGGAAVGGLSSQSQSQSRSSGESVGLATQGAGADQRRPLVDDEDSRRFWSALLKSGCLVWCVHCNFNFKSEIVGHIELIL